LKVFETEPSTDAAHVKVYIAGLSVEKDKSYTIAFWAKLDAKEGDNREVIVYAQMQQSPWILFLNQTITLDSTEWKEYVNTFAGTADAKDNVDVGLKVAQSNVDFWIDDFRFFEGAPSDEIKPIETAVKPMGKLPVSWGRIKGH